MRQSLRILQRLPTFKNPQTFGEILESDTKSTLQKTHLKPPPGYEILESKFHNEINDFGKYLTSQLNDEGITKTQTKDEVLKIFDNFMNGYKTNNNHSKTSKSLTAAQRKMLMAAYAKAGWKLNEETNKNSKLNKTKLSLVIKRNWNILEFIVKSNGVEIDENKNTESWGFEDELSEEISTNETKNNFVEDTKPRHQLIDHSKADFNSFLKNLNKVHQTRATHVLPRMTTFKPQPTIISLDVNIPDNEVKDFETFLNNAKRSSDSMDEDLFKAKNNYEITKNVISKYHRSFENLNFFTPVCIPGTLLDIENFGIELTMQFQHNFKNRLELKDIEKFEIMKIYVDGKSSILTNENKIYWDGTISNIYQIMHNLKDPISFKSRFQKCLKNSWIPVGSEEREIIMVRDPKQHKKLYIKRSLIIGGISTILAFGVFCLSTMF